MRPCVEKRIGPLFGQRDLIAMKLKLDGSCHLPDVYTRFQVHISKYVEKSSENFPPAGRFAQIPLLSVCGHQKVKNCPTMTKISTGQRHLLYVCVPNLKALYNF